MKITKKIFLVLAMAVAMAVCFAFGTSAISESGSLGNNVTYTYDSSTGTVVISGEGETKDYSNQSYYGVSPFYEATFNHLIIEDGVTGIGENVFCYGKVLESITIGADLADVENVFSCGFEGKSITVNENNKYFSNDEHGVLFNKERTELLKHPSGKTETFYIIPDGVTVIGKGAFEFCSNLSKVEIPDSVTVIGKDAFLYCVYLESIIIPEGVVSIGREAFNSCWFLEKVTLPSTLEFIDTQAFGWCYSLKEINIPEGVTLGECSFYMCISLESITIPSTAQLVYYEEDDYVDVNFCECFSLKDIYILNDNIKLSPYCIGWNETSIDETKISTDEWVRQFLSCMELYKTDPDTALKLEVELEKYLISNDNMINPYITIHAHAGSTAETYAKEYGFKFEEIKDTVIEDVTVTDENTGVTAEYTSDIFDDTPEMVITEGGKNANIAFNGKFGKYTSYDISFEIDGEKVQPNGKVTIKIPLPEGYNPNSVKVFFIDDNGNKTKLDSTYENGYIIFETDHFSEYAIVDESSEIIDEPATEPDEPTTNPDDTADNNCSCNCHKSGFMGFIWKILCFFYKLFKTNPVCACGIAHY